MANPIITNCDIGSVALTVTGTYDGILKNTVAAAHTFVAGTLLALHSGDGKLYPFDPASVTNNLGQPKYVLTYPVTVLASGETGVQVMSAGRVNQNRLVVDGGTVNAATLDLLLDRPIIPVDVKQLAKIDNPQ